MQEVAISEFKAKCLALLEQVRATKKPLRITRFGKPVAEVVATGHGHLGWTMAAGSGQLLADLMSGASPVIDPDVYALSRFATARP